VNTLTDKERNGLEDVFLSIKKNKRIGERDGIFFSSFILNYRLKYTKMVQKGSKLPKLAQFFTKKRKKKKNLSK